MNNQWEIGNRKSSNCPGKYFLYFRMKYFLLLEKLVTEVVRHIVIWKLKETDPGQKFRILEEFRSRLLALKNEIPGITGMEVKFNAEKASASNDDIVLIADFTDWKALNDYQVHPAHQNLVSWVSAVRISRSAIDYEI